MIACQSISAYALQQDQHYSIERSHSRSESSTASSQSLSSSSSSSSLLSSSPTTPMTSGFFSDQYSKLLFFEKHADQSIHSLLKEASSERLGLAEIVTVMRMIEKAFDVEAHACVKDLVLQRVTLFISSSSSSPSSTDHGEKDEETLQSLFGFLYDSCFELKDQEGDLLHDLLTSLSNTLFSLLSSSSSSSLLMKKRMCSIAQGVIILISLLDITDPALSAKLVYVAVNMITNLDLPNQLSSSSSSSSAFSLRTTADHLIQALHSTTGNLRTIWPYVHAAEIVMESQVHPEVYSTLFPSSSANEISHYLEFGQSVLSYYHRSSFYDALALSMINSISSSSPSSSMTSAQTVNMVNAPMNESSLDIRQDLCSAILESFIRNGYTSEAFFFIYHPFLVGFSPLID